MFESIFLIHKNKKSLALTKLYRTAEGTLFLSMFSLEIQETKKNI